MRREIKFRAWDKKRKKMLFNHDHEDDDSWFMIDFLGLIWRYCNTDYYPFADTSSDVEEETYNENLILMQYTGLKDYENKEIWEGDIILEPYLNERPSICVIKFHNGAFLSHSQEDASKRVSGYSDINVKSVKVIGNIYENPELLEAPTP